VARWYSNGTRKQEKLSQREEEKENMKLAKLALGAASVSAAAIITAGCSSASSPYVAGRDQCGSTTTTSVVNGKAVTTSTPRYCAIMSDGDQVLLNYMLWQNLMYGSTLQRQGNTYVYVAPSNPSPAPVASSYSEADTPVSTSDEESEEDNDSTWDDGGSEYGDADPNYDSESNSSSDDDGASDTDESGDNSDRYSDSDSDSDSGYSDSDESDDDG
jgi:hypothetical protein